MNLEDVFDAAPDAVVVADADGNLLKVNSHAAVLFGYEAAELIGQPVEVLLPERFRDNHYRYRADYMKAPSLRPMGAGQNLTARRKDGTEVPVDIMLSPLKGDSPLVLVTVRDARERQRKEYELRTSEAMFKALFDQAPDAIVAVNERGQIARTNRQVEAFLGYTEAELRGQPIEVLVPERFRDKHVGQRAGYTACPMSRPMGAGLDLCARRKDGSEVPVDIMLSPVQIPGSKLVISVVRDITERKKSADQLKRSNEELERFAYVASHDLQEPLRAVTSSCNMIEKRLGEKVDEDTKEFIWYAVDGAKRMQELIRDLLNYSRVGRGDKFSDVDLGMVMERVANNLKPQIDDCGALIEALHLPTVKGDFGQLVQLFQNLVSNAMKFKGADKPHVRISAERDRSAWKIAVADNGIGIPETYRDKIFVLFQRLHRRDQYPGTGIGLAICKKIVEHHGGQIWVESQVGQGATFVFRLPA